MARMDKNNRHRPSLPGRQRRSRRPSVVRFKHVLQQHFPVIQERYKVKSLGLFGSYVRNDQKKGSDLDVLVEFDRAPTFFEFIDLEDHLSNLLGVKVDLVMKSALKPAIGRRILSEVVPV
jgi:hypothetical protein